MHTRRPHGQSAASKHHVRYERFVLVLGFLLALSALLFFGWLAEEMMEGDTARLDSPITSIMHEHATARLTTVMKALTMLGSPVVMTPLAILTLAFCYLRREFHALKNSGGDFWRGFAIRIFFEARFPSTSTSGVFRSSDARV